MSRFADATAVRADGEGHDSATIHEGWDIGGNANGGYLLAIATRAMTVELTVHVRRAPAQGPLRCLFRSRFIGDGLLDEEGEAWDSTGALV